LWGIAEDTWQSILLIKLPGLGWLKSRGE